MTRRTKEPTWTRRSGFPGAPPRLKTARMLWLAIGLMGLTLVPSAASAQDDCHLPEVQLDKYQYLRSLSLDLLGRPPTMEEYEALHAVEDVPQATIDTMLASDEFAQRAVRWHRGLLWNNVRNQSLFSTRARIRVSGDLWWRSGASAVLYRGLSRVCNDEPAVPDGNGGYVQTMHTDGSMREGYVMVTPYWDPSTQIKVCAYDALEFAEAPDGTPCNTTTGMARLGCGCGPNLQWCSTAAHEDLVQDMFAQDIDQRVFDVVVDNRPYTDLFTEDRMWVDGPTVHYWKHQTGVPAGLSNNPPPLDSASLPDMAYSDMEPMPVVVPTGHAGVLTAPGFLLRFQTNRGRANRFYDGFLCQPFQAPAGPLPLTDLRALAEPDLQKRDGCKYCHALLEPAAAFWGRWTERGAGFLAPESYPAMDPECQACAQDGLSCSATCQRNYLTRASDPGENLFLGQLNAYVFRYPEHYSHVEIGPELLISDAVVDNRLLSCTTTRAAEQLLGRSVFEEEQPWVAAVTSDFAHDGFGYQDLVRSIVTSPTYRRVR